MNYIKHLTAFFEKVSQDYDLNPTHISLYIALFQSWNYNRFQNPVSICRGEIMRISKIASFATYHKCIKDLDVKGYIKYEPSYNPFKGSLVHIIDLTEELKVKKNSKKAKVKNEQVNEQAIELPTKQALNKHQTSTEQALVSSINSIKHIKHYKHDIEPTKNKNENNLLNNSENEEKKLREKKKSETDSKIPILANVISFFLENNHSQIEAEKFFNYFESNGWLVGGKTKMKNWKAAAKNWMLNSNKYAKPTNRHPDLACTERSRSIEGPKPNHLHSNQNKNYDEPL